MAGTQVEGTHGTVVVGYLRKSSSGKQKQEASIPDQRAAIIAHCEKRGWVIAGWYTDSKSGSKDAHLRLDFQRLLDDAERPGRSWAGVVVWSTSRFSRANSLDSSAPNRLHGVGVWLESVSEGRADWDTEIGRLTWALGQEKNHGYSVSLSKDSTRGRRSAIARGFWAHGRVPYGYDRLYVRDGQEPVLLPRRQDSGRPGGYSLKLSINRGEAVHVRWIFSQVLAGRSLRWIAGELNRQGHPTPYGGESGIGWLAVSVRQVIQQPAYVGDVQGAYNHRSNVGKFNTIRDVTASGTVPPILEDRSVWDTANRLLKDRGGKRAQLKNGAKAKSGLLSGLVTCGHCGYALKKAVRKQRTCGSCGTAIPRATKDGTCLACGEAAGDLMVPVTYYYCAASSYYPGTSSCRCHVAYESQILPGIRDRLIASIEGQILRSVLAKPADQPNVDLEAMRERAKGLSAQVARGLKRLLDVDDDLLAEAHEVVRNRKAELEAVEAQIRLAESTTSDAERQRVVGWLDNLKGEWVTLDPGEGTFDTPTIPVTMAPAEAAEARRLLARKGAQSPVVVAVPVEGRKRTLFVAADLTAVEVKPKFREVRAPLEGHRDALRGLLERLGVKVALHWRPADKGKLETLDFARISAKFGLCTGEVIDTCDYRVTTSNDR